MEPALVACLRFYGKIESVSDYAFTARVRRGVYRLGGAASGSSRNYFSSKAGSDGSAARAVGG